MSFVDGLPDKDFVPTPDQRTYWRHTTTGDRGYFTRIDGVDYIQLDRPQEEVRRPFNAGEWNVEEEYRPLTMAAVAQVAQSADAILCQSLGMHELGRMEWNGLTDAQRILWMDHGPQKDPVRAELWRAIMGVLRPLAD